MKIAHIVDTMEVGGAEMLVLQMCRMQRESGHDPLVYAVDILGPLGEMMQAEGFKVKSNVGRHATDSFRNFHQIFKSERPDVVHSHNPTPTIYAAIAARLAGVPSIISTRHSLVASPRNLTVELKYAVAARFCDWVVGICESTVKNLKSIHTLPPRKIRCVYNGTAPLQRSPSESWPTKTGFTLVYIGRLEPIKNHTLLLNAFRTALLSRPDLRLWMVGDGSQFKVLENLSAELGIVGHVKFCGQQLDVAPFFSAADAFIMSSKSEGLPMSLLQAMSLGLPSIVTDVGGMAEVVRLANGGLIVGATDPEEMVAGILRLADRSEEREHFSRNAYEAFRSRFTLQSMVDTYMDLYRNTPRAQGGSRSQYSPEEMLRPSK